MFNSTHTFVGLALARTAPNGWLRHAAITAVIASNLPDIDLISGIPGTPSYMQYHRGITHSLIGVPVLSLIVAAAMYWFSGSFWKTFLIAFAAMTTHPLLDFANNYGWRPFLPFDGTWYYGDTLSIIDPYLDLILLTGILTGQYFRSFRQAFAWGCIVLAIAYIGLRVDLHNEARIQLNRFAATIPGIERSAVLPQMVNPFIWDGILETERDILKVRISALDGVGPALARRPRGHTSEIITRAASTVSAIAFSGFARFPVTRIEGGQFGYRVTFLDFRYYDETSGTGFAADVQLDKSLNVVKESLGFNQTIE